MREFLFAEDLADACLSLWITIVSLVTLILELDTDITIKQLAETVAKVVGFEGEIAMGHQ